VLRRRDGHAADPVAFCVRAHIDQLDARIGLQQRPGLLRSDGAGVWQAGLGRGLQQFLDFHVDFLQF
jgi:hypothetical protein